MTTYEKTESAEVEKMLSYIDPDISRSIWIAIGAALKDEYGDETGRQLFETWSKTGTKYQERQFSSDWKALAKRTSAKPSTMGTVVHHAKQGGYASSRARREVITEAKTPRASPSPSFSNPIEPSTRSSPPISESERADAFERAVAYLLRSHKGIRATRHEYSDTYYKIRIDCEDGSKTFRPLSFNSSSQTWDFCDPTEMKLPLYGLRDLVELAKEDFVYIVEGEKCVESIRSMGLVAITSANGSESAKRSDWSPLRGRSVVIIPDQDEAGAKYAAEVSTLLRGLDCEVRVLDLRGSSKETPKGFDIADWTEDSEQEECEDLGARLRSLAAEARITIPRRYETIRDALSTVAKDLSRTHGRKTLGTVSKSFKKLDEALDGWRGFGILVAKPGIGKTNLLLQVGREIVEQNPEAVFLFFSLEMDCRELLYRALCQTSGLNYSVLRKGSPPVAVAIEKGKDGLLLSKEDRAAYEEALETLGKYGDRIRLVERDEVAKDFSGSFEEICRDFMLKKRATRAFVIVDHLAKIPSSETEPLAKDDARIDLLLQSQRRLGEDCCVVAISESRKTDYEAPSMESAKGSSEIAYSPDFMLALSDANPSDDDARDLHPRRIRVSILKGRAGTARRSIYLDNHWKEQRYEESEDQSPPPSDEYKSGRKRGESR
jgi:5S rRNA maturation endonuclease (ribonuclease M5)